MYMNSLAFAYALEPPSVTSKRRTLLSTLLYAAGAIVGWPFSLALAIPFVLEELLVYGADIVSPQDWSIWWSTRVKRLINAGQIAALVFVCLFCYQSRIIS